MKTKTTRVKNKPDNQPEKSKWQYISGMVVIISVFTFLTIMGIVYSPAFANP